MSKRYLQGVTLLIGLGDADAIQLNLRNTSGFVGNVFDSLAWICTVSLRLILYSVHGLYYVLDLSTCFVLSVNFAEPHKRQHANGVRRQNSAKK